MDEKSASCLNDLASAATCFNAAVKCIMLTDPWNSRAILSCLTWDEKERLTELGATDAGFNGVTAGPAVGIERAEIMARVMIEAGAKPERMGEAYIPAALRTPENVAAAHEMAPYFSRLLQPK